MTVTIAFSDGHESTWAGFKEPNQSTHKTNTSNKMVTRRTSSLKVTPGPTITFGHLIVVIGLCGILFNTTINLNSSAEEVHQSFGSRKTPDTGTVRGLERGIPNFHLNVPFYVYEDRDLNWEDATLNDQPYAPAAPSAGGCGTFRTSHTIYFLQICKMENIRTTTGTSKLP